MHPWAEAWRARGGFLDVDGHDIFVVDVPADDEQAPPVLIVHGFPTCSFDWRLVVDRLAHGRRVVTLDLLGYGWSAKPDRSYSLFRQADLVVAVARHHGLSEVALVTHDMGDTIGGELLARDLDGDLDLTVERRVLTNGSIYLELARLSPVQRLLEALPDRRLPAWLAPPRIVAERGLGRTFGPDTPMGADEFEAQWDLFRHRDGHRLVTRLIRYLDERREHQDRWTGAIERHPSPLTVVWGDADPIAVPAIAERLLSRRPDTRVRWLERIGHYPMLEAPDAFADAVLEGLASRPTGG